MKFTCVLSLLFGLCFTFALTAQVDKKDKKEEEKKEDKVLGKTISEWIRILREHENPKFRKAALIALEASNTAHRQGLPAILDAIEKDKEVQIRVECVNLLGRLGPEVKPSLRALVGALQTDKSEAVREAAATVLANKFAQIASDYVEIIAAALNDAHPGTRIAVASTLRNMGKDASPAFPALLAAAENAKEQVLVRVAAVHVLSRHAKDDPKMVPMLVAIVKGADNATALREAAVEGLGLSKSGASNVVAVLGESLTDKSLEMRKSAAAALGALGPKASTAWPIIKGRLSEKGEVDSAVRNHLIRLTGTLGKTIDEAIPALSDVAAVDTSSENRIAAIQELGELGSRAKGALPTLTAIRTDDARAAIRDAADKAITKIKGK